MNMPPLSLGPLSAIDLTAPPEVEGRSLDAVLRDFESIFVSMMIKEMRKTVESGFFGGDKADALGGLFDMTLGDTIARQGGLGLAAALARYQEIAENDRTVPSSGDTQ